jgi:hypothetical protein
MCTCFPEFLGFEEVLTDSAAHTYRIVTIDGAGRTAKTDDLQISAV